MKKLNKREKLSVGAIIVSLGLLSYLYWPETEDEYVEEVRVTQTSSGAKAPATRKVQTTKRIIYNVPTIENYQLAAKMINESVNAKEATLFLRTTSSTRALKKTLELAKIEKELAVMNLEAAKANKEISEIGGKNEDEESARNTVLMTDVVLTNNADNDKKEIVLNGVYSRAGIDYANIRYGKKSKPKSQVGDRFGKNVIKAIDVTNSCVEFKSGESVCL